MANRKRIKQKNKRQLQKRYKQTAKVPVLDPREKGNSDYKLQLEALYGKGIIIPIERFISPQATLIHFCNECSKKFYAKPRYLLKTKHDCTSGGIDSSLNYPKKTKSKVSKNVNGKELAKSLDRMILSGVKPHLITSKTGVSSQIVKWYKEKYHAGIK